MGTDDEGYAPQVIKLAGDLRIGDRVRILPRTVVGCEKEHLFNAARVFVLPSYSENFGNTVLEAMRRAVPVVVTPEVGAAEVVREARAGLVVAGDPEPLGTAINRFIEDPEFARSVGELGRHHVVEHYGWDRISARMEDLYEALVRRK